MLINNKIIIARNKISEIMLINNKIIARYKISEIMLINNKIIISQHKTSKIMLINNKIIIARHKQNNILAPISLRHLTQILFLHPFRCVIWRKIICSCDHFVALFAANYIRVILYIHLLCYLLYIIVYEKIIIFL